MEEQDYAPFVTFKGTDRKPRKESNVHEDAPSEDVLIDPNGYRTIFRVGYYSFADKKWRLHDESMEKYIEEDHLYWTSLPIDREAVRKDIEGD